MINCRKSLIFRSLLKYPTRAKLKRNELNELFQSFLQKHPCRQIRTLAESNEQSQNSEWLDKEFHRKTRPNSLMSRTMYLVNVETASKISKHLTNKTSDRTPTIVETNPGPGMLTEFLVERGVTDLRLFEGREEFVAHLDDRYVKVHPDRVKLQHFDLANLQRLMHLDNSHKILSTLPTTEWQSDINFRLFVATGSMIFFRQLITSVVFKNGLLATGRFESYVAVPSIIYMTLTSSNLAGYSYYRAISILFQLFFEYQLLDKFPRSDFVPYITNERQRCGRNRSWRKLLKIDPELMYLMKIVPRRDLDRLCPPDHIQELWHFIRFTFLRRSNRIIPVLEKVIPGCGAQLLVNISMKKSEQPKPTYKVDLCERPPLTNPSITLSNRHYPKGFNIYTQFGELKPTELFTLFHEFRQLPEYANCTFLPALQNVLLKMNSKIDVDQTNTRSKGR